MKLVSKTRKDAPSIVSREPNADDAWLDALREGCARAMATWLKESVNTQRQINTLKLPEMMALAEACTAHWICEVSKHIADEEMTPTVRQYTNLLLA